MIRSNCRMAWLGFAAASVIARVAYAQEKPGQPLEDQAPLTTLSRIVVTAGAEKVAIQTPQAVTTLDQEDIDAKQASTIADSDRRMVRE